MIPAGWKALTAAHFNALWRAENGSAQEGGEPRYPRRSLFCSSTPARVLLAEGSIHERPADRSEVALQAHSSETIACAGGELHDLRHDSRVAPRRNEECQPLEVTTGRLVMVRVDTRRTGAF